MFLALKTKFIHLVIIVIVQSRPLAAPLALLVIALVLLLVTHFGFPQVPPGFHFIAGPQLILIDTPFIVGRHQRFDFLTFVCPSYPIVIDSDYTCLRFLFSSLLHFDFPIASWRSISYIFDDFSNLYQDLFCLKLLACQRDVWRKHDSLFRFYRFHAYAVPYLD